MERKENVVFLGPPGVGKSHLAISLAIAAAQSGRRVYINIRGNSYRMRHHTELWRSLNHGDSASASAPKRRTRRSKEKETTGGPSPIMPGGPIFSRR